jgi:energy-coupling factor transport system permease protein
MSSRKQGLIKRLKNAASMLFPLIISSIGRIEVIANAMELRGFGKNKKRTWYTSRPFRASDFFSIAFSVLAVVAALVLQYFNGGRYFNPFVS